MGTLEPARVLVLDVGGTSVKYALGDAAEPHRLSSGEAMGAEAFVEQVRRATSGWRYDRVSVGFPGPVRASRPAREPVNLAGGWVTLDWERAFGVPVRVTNDAALQALGNHAGGSMLFLGLGTGLGTTLVGDGFVHALEVAHLPYRPDGSYEDYVGERGFRRLPRAEWEAHVFRVTALLRDAMQVDDVVLGGGRVHLLEALPEGARRGRDDAAIRGGVALWARG